MFWNYFAHTVTLLSGKMCVWSSTVGLFRAQDFSVGIQVHPAKVEFILSGHAPKNMIDHQHFLDFVSFYREFFPNLFGQIQIVYLQPRSISRLKNAFLFPASTKSSESLLWRCVQRDAFSASSIKREKEWSPALCLIHFISDDCFQLKEIIFSIRGYLL